jgi:hypothetical protein
MYLKANVPKHRRVVSVSHREAVDLAQDAHER